MICPDRAGFTLIEIVIAITIMIAGMGIAFPTVRDTVVKESIRGSRLTFTTSVARARAAAAQRGCPAVVHFTAGSDAQTWTTTCGAGGIGIDTIGTVEYLSRRFGVAVEKTADSLVFAPTGIAYSAGWIYVSFEKGSYADTVQLSPLGRVQ